MSQYRHIFLDLGVNRDGGPVPDLKDLIFCRYFFVDIFVDIFCRWTKTQNRATSSKKIFKHFYWTKYFCNISELKFFTRLNISYILDQTKNHNFF